jgi:hypothetical protein
MLRLAFAASVVMWSLAASGAEQSAQENEQAWQWSRTDAPGYFSENAPEKAELRISGDRVSGSLFAGDGAYASLEGALQPVSVLTDANGTTTHTWKVVARTTMLQGGPRELPSVLEGTFTRSDVGSATARVKVYEVFALSDCSGESNSVRMSRVELAPRMRSAWRSH